LQRDGNEVIKIRSDVQFDEPARNYTLHTANSWGCNNPMHSYKRKQKIAHAACMLTSYDYDYAASAGWTKLSEWNSQIKNSIKDGNTAHIGSNIKGSKS
jgi:hypothetical protein